MAFSNSVLTVLVLVSLVLAALAAAVVVGPGRARNRRRRARADLPPDKAMEVQVQVQARAIQRLEGAVRYVGVVRFDAFEDMGGRLSFSAALLDARGDGVVITSINGRQDTRCYAKQVRSGSSPQNLSDEEREAIRVAQRAPRQIVEAS